MTASWPNTTVSGPYHTDAHSGPPEDREYDQREAGEETEEGEGRNVRMFSNASSGVSCSVDVCVKPLALRGRE